ADPGGACPDCVRIVIEGFRAEVERLRGEQVIDRQALDRAAADHARLRVEVTDERRRRAVYVRGIEAERDRLTEQARRVWMAAAEMHEFNSPEGDHLEGCPGCRIEAALSGTEARQ